jgi:hypothetical protein
MSGHTDEAKDKKGSASRLCYCVLGVVTTLLCGTPINPRAGVDSPLANQSQGHNRAQGLEC